MELPIYQENLRSSGAWLTGLGQAREAWATAQTQPEAIARVRELQANYLGAAALSAAQILSAWATAAEAKLDVPRLLELNRALTNGEPLFRESEIAPLNAAHEPPLARLVPRLLDNAMSWFVTEGFAEMNPVEQATLVHLRLLDLQPFAAANLPTATLAASFYLERAGLPPLLFDPNETRYVAALESGFRMLTQHLVDYFAASLQQTISNLKFEIL
jgi:Fic family protein